MAPPLLMHFLDRAPTGRPFANQPRIDSPGDERFAAPGIEAHLPRRPQSPFVAVEFGDNRRMRPLAPLLILASLLSLAACPASSLDPNGKNHQLFFFGHLGMLSRHLEQSLVIPTRVTHKDLLWPEETRTFDFSGTTLEVSGTGIESPTATLNADGDYEIRFRCMTPSGQPTELAVRVMAGSSVRYADAIDITCYEPEVLEAQVPSMYAVQDPSAVVLGGQFKLYASVGAVVGDFSYPQTLEGTGFGFADAGPMSLVSETSAHNILGEEMVLRAERLGRDPVLAVGPLQAVVPMEVVPDGDWTLKLYTSYSVTHYLVFGGYAGLADGGTAIGFRDACSFQLGNLTGLTVDEHECQGYGGNQPDGGQICIDALGRNACGTW